MGVNYLGKGASVIEINNVRYDASTGRAVSKVNDFAKSRLATSSQVIDGFVKSKSVAKPRTEKTKRVIEKPKSRPAHSVRSNAKTVHRKAEHSRTLLRSVVARPSLRLKQATGSLASPLSKKTRFDADRHKQLRASQVKKHTLVNRFGTARPKQPVAEIQMGQVIARPNLVEHGALSARSTSRTTALPTSLGTASHQQLERLLDVALHTAKSHKHSLKKSHSKLGDKFFSLPRWIKIVVFVVITVTAMVLIAWKNIPAVAVRVASVQANIDASMPTYTPVGYSFSGPASGSSGTVNFNYKSTSSQNSGYTITERKSSWDSTTLTSNAIGSDVQVQTSQVGGNTIFIYGPNNNAAWVSDGIWYSITNNANLSSDQLLRIVQSMQ